MKNLTTYLFTIILIYTNSLKASDNKALEERNPEQLLTHFADTRDVRDLCAFNKALACQGDILKNKISEPLVSRVTEAMFQPLKSEVNLDHVGSYPTMRPLVTNTILFCARMQPKLLVTHLDKLIAACELCRTVDHNKLAGMGLFDNKVVELTWAIDTITRHYKKTIPTKLLADYSEYDPLSKFSVQFGYFLYQQLRFYRKKPRTAIAMYLTAIATLFALKRYLSSKR